MADYEDGAAALEAYAGHVVAVPPTIDRLSVLTMLAWYLEEQASENVHISEDERQRLGHTFNVNLARPDWAELVRDALASDDIDNVRRVLNKAKDFGVDAGPVARSWLDRRPLDGYLWQWLLGNVEGSEKHDIVSLAERMLPLQSLANGPAEDLGGGLEYEADFCLQIIVQRLADHPGEGWALVQAALHNRVVGARNCALRVLKTWPRESWPSEVLGTLNEIVWKEPREATRKTIRELLGLSSGS